VEESGEKYSYHTTDAGQAAFLNRLESKHKYCFSVRDDECIKWWWYGTRDDVLAPEGKASSLFSLPPSGQPIPVKLESDVVFETV
jgi:DNA-binding PadR family transcriptional regulator